MTEKDITIYLVDADDSARNGVRKFLTTAGYMVKDYSSIRFFAGLDRIKKHSCLVIDENESGDQNETTVAVSETNNNQSEP